MENKYKVESPIEEKYLETVLPHIQQGATLESQVKVKAGSEQFRLDFLVTFNGWRLAVECDGREFHDLERDERRDLLCLNDGVCDGILRLRGCDVFFDDESCLKWTTYLSGGAFGHAVNGHDIFDLQMVAGAMMGGHSRPTYRGRIPLTNFQDNRTALANFRAGSVVCRTTDGKYAIIQLRHPEWNWKYEGPQIWQLLDKVRFDLQTKGWSQWLPLINGMMEDERSAVR